MREVNLRSIDLNLLVVLDVLLEVRHVSRAAERLSMSQPAVSRALQRLRDTFNDPLLVRTAEGYDLSARAQAILPQLHQVMQSVAGMISNPEFDPLTANSLVRITGLDLETALYIPQLSHYLQTAAPNLRMELVSQVEDQFQLLDTGDVHFLLTGMEPAYSADQFHRMALDRMGVVCLMDQDNPLAEGELSLRRYAAARHGMVSITGRGLSRMDDLLASFGLSRTIYLRLASFMSVADFCEGTELIFTLPERLAEHIVQGRRLVTRRLPAEVIGREVTFYLYWHSRHHRDPTCKWLRQQFSRMVQNNSLKNDRSS